MLGSTTTLTELQAKLTDLQQQVVTLKRERVQWRAAVGSSVTAELDAAATRAQESTTTSQSFTFAVEAAERRLALRLSLLGAQLEACASPLQQHDFSDTADRDTSPHHDQRDGNSAPNRAASIHGSQRGGGDKSMKSLSVSASMRKFLANARGGDPSSGGGSSGSPRGLKASDDGSAPTTKPPKKTLPMSKKANKSGSGAGADRFDMSFAERRAMSLAAPHPRSELAARTTSLSPGMHHGRNSHRRPSESSSHLAPGHSVDDDGPALDDLSRSRPVSPHHTFQTSHDRPVTPPMRSNAVVSHRPEYGLGDAALAVSQPMPQRADAAASQRDQKQSDVLKREMSRKIAENQESHGDESRRGLSERHPVMATLDVLFVVASFFACTLAMGLSHNKGHDFHEDSSLFPFVLGGMVLIDIVSLVWLGSRFFLAQRRGEWEIVDDIGALRKRYLKSWFGYDLIYSFPFELAFIVWSWPVYRWISLRHFLRLPRIILLGESFNPLLSSRLWYRFMSVVIILLIVVFAVAAVFWSLEDDYSYEESVYWAIATVTSVGYGDIIPTHGGSRLYVCFAMLAGVAVLSTMTAFATSFLTHQDRLTAEAEAKKHMMHAMLEYYRIPWSLQKEVIAAMPRLLESLNKESFAELTGRLPEFVGNRVMDYVEARALSEITIFKRVARLNPDHLLWLTHYVDQSMHPAETIIAEEGSEADCLYIVVRGAVRLVTVTFDDPDDEDGDGDCEAQLIELGTAEAGDTFGELDLDNPGGHRLLTAISNSVCELVVLHQSKLEALKNTHPETFDALADAIAVNDELGDLADATRVSFASDPRKQS